MKENTAIAFIEPIECVSSSANDLVCNVDKATDKKLPKFLEPVFFEECELLTNKEQTKKFKDFLPSRVHAFADPGKPAEKAHVGKILS